MQATKVFPQFTDADKARFWSKVDKRGEADCWEWKAGLFQGTQYGMFWVGGGNIGAHVFAHIASGGTFERGPVIRHVVCRNKKCCNPSHLMDGTHQDNSDDAQRDGTVARGERHGSKTHPERLPRGDNNPARKHPENMARGDRNGSRTRPERLRRGDNHPARLHPERMARGERQGAAKLTEEKVRNIRAMYASGGHSLRELGREFLVTKRAIQMIIRRESWRHVA